MKCADCGTRVRPRDGRCGACGRAFAFHPARDPHPVTDADFASAIQKVTISGSVYFTARQLWYAFHRVTTNSDRWDGVEWWAGLSAAAVPVALVLLGVLDLGIVGTMGLALAAMFVASLLADHLVTRPARERPLKPPAIPFELFRDHYLPRWAEVHGLPERLLPDPTPDTAPREVPADVAAFSFDRAVVTQHAEIAALLVANRFHFHNACAVLSLDGYPFGIAETVKEMLRRNPGLTVFALHDASAEGFQLPRRLRDPDWFPDPAILVVDVGITAVGYHRKVPILPGTPRALPGGRKTLEGWSRSSVGSGSRIEVAALGWYEIAEELQRAFAGAGLPGHPTRDEVLRRAAATGGIIAVSALPWPSPGDSSTTDGGFG